MPRQSNEKCRLCSKLSAPEAQQRHGATGDGCWAGQPCHTRRSYYRHRGVRNQQRRGKELGLAILTVPAPSAPAVVIHWYRETKDAPLHALGAELWMGNDRIAKIAPVHCLGLTELQIKTVLVRILDVCSQHLNKKIERFRSSVEMHPQNCPLRPCPLFPE